MTFLARPEQPMSRRAVGRLAAAGIAAWVIAAGLLVAGPPDGGADIGGGAAVLVALFLSALTGREALVLREDGRAHAGHR